MMQNVWLCILSQPETGVCVEVLEKHKQLTFLFDKLNEELTQDVYQELLVQVGLEFLWKYIIFFYYLRK